MTTLQKELAKELMEAGFSGKEEKIYMPTLSELIEACGEEFYQLRKVDKTNNDFGWIVHTRNDVAGFSGYGDTPEEAVTRCWLELNKK